MPPIGLRLQPHFPAPTLEDGVETWSVAKVVEWSKVKFPKSSEAISAELRKKQVDGLTLLRLSYEDMAEKRLEIADANLRVRMLMYIEQLRKARISMLQRAIETVLAVGQKAFASPPISSSSSSGSDDVEFLYVGKKRPTMTLLKRHRLTPTPGQAIIIPDNPASSPSSSSKSPLARRRGKGGKRGSVGQLPPHPEIEEGEGEGEGDESKVALLRDRKYDSPEPITSINTATVRSPEEQSADEELEFARKKEAAYMEPHLLDQLQRDGQAAIENDPNMAQSPLSDTKWDSISPRSGGLNTTASPITTSPAFSTISEASPVPSTNSNINSNNNNIDTNENDRPKKTSRKKKRSNKGRSDRPSTREEERREKRERHRKRRAADAYDISKDRIPRRTGSNTNNNKANPNGITFFNDNTLMGSGTDEDVDVGAEATIKRLADDIEPGFVIGPGSKPINSHAPASVILSSGLNVAPSPAPYDASLASPLPSPRPSPPPSADPSSSLSSSSSSSSTYPATPANKVRPFTAAPGRAKSTVRKQFRSPDELELRPNAVGTPPPTVGRDKRTQAHHQQHLSPSTPGSDISASPVVLTFDHVHSPQQAVPSSSSSSSASSGQFSPLPTPPWQQRNSKTKSNDSQRSPDSFGSFSNLRQERHSRRNNNTSANHNHDNNTRNNNKRPLDRSTSAPYSNPSSSSSSSRVAPAPEHKRNRMRSNQSPFHRTNRTNTLGRSPTKSAQETILDAFFQPTTSSPRYHATEPQPFYEGRSSIALRASAGRFDNMKRNNSNSNNNNFSPTNNRHRAGAGSGGSPAPGPGTRGLQVPIVPSGGGLRMSLNNRYSTRQIVEGSTLAPMVNNKIGKYHSVYVRHSNTGGPAGNIAPGARHIHHYNTDDPYLQYHKTERRRRRASSYDVPMGKVVGASHNINSSSHSPASSSSSSSSTSNESKRTSATSLSRPTTPATRKQSIDIALASLRNKKDHRIDHTKGERLREKLGISALHRTMPEGVIHPNWKWRVRWELFILLLVIYYAIFTPLNMAFDSAFEYIPVEIILTLFFLVDIVINFCTAFYYTSGPHQGELETNHRAIACNYVHYWFWVDLLAFIPLDLIFLLAFGSSDVNNLNKLLRILRGFKLIRVIKVLRAARAIVARNQINPSVLRLIKLFGLLIFMWHWIGCFYWMISRLEEEDYEEDVNVWVPRQQYLDSSYGTQYIQAFFWAIMITTGVGRDVDPATDYEALFTCVSITLGFMMMAFIIGQASTTMNNIDTAQAERRRKVEAITNYLRQRSVPLSLSKRILAFYEYMWSRHLALDERNQGLLQDLHPALHTELEVVLNKKLIKTVPMFKGITTDCLLALASSLISTIYLPMELVVVMGEIPRCMHFVVRGKLEVLKTERIKILTDGMSFGKRCLLMNERCRATVRAMTFCELLQLDRNDFRIIVARFEGFKLNLQKFMQAPAVENLEQEYKHDKWMKVRMSIKTLRMIKFLGGNSTFEECYTKIGQGTTLSEINNDFNQAYEREKSKVGLRYPHGGLGGALLLSDTEESDSSDGDSTSSEYSMSYNVDKDNIL